MKRLSQSRIAKLISAVVLVNLLWLNVAAAQTPTPTPAPTATPTSTTTTSGNTQTIIITGAEWKAAQTDQNACVGTDNSSMKNKVSNLSQNRFKTYYLGSTFESVEYWETKGCYIIDGDARDEGGSVAFSSAADKLFDDKLKSLAASQQLSSSDWVEINLQASQDQSSVGVLSKLIGGVINSMLTTVASTIAVLSVTMGGVMDLAIHNTLTIDYNTVNIVNTGWVVVRDFANMFFILILIVIGLGTILRIDKLNYRHLLGELVLMAILVNFSKVIAITIISFANSVALIFYQGNIKDIFVAFFQILRPDQMATSTGEAWNTALGQGIGKLAFSIVALVSFTVLAIMFVIRLVGLYVFIIFSPMYFVMDILPATKDGAHKFLHKFVHYVFWVPVALFMLRITILLAQNSGSGVQGLKVGNNSAFTFIIITGFLWATILIAEHAGMVGGKAVVNLVEKGAHGTAHIVGGYTGEKWNNFTSKIGGSQNGKPPGRLSSAAFAILNPKAAVGGWREASHERQHEAQAKATATGRELSDRIVTGRNLIPHVKNLERAEINKYVKSYQEMNSEERKTAMLELANDNSAQAKVLKQALLRVATEDKDIRGLAIAYGQKFGPEQAGFDVAAGVAGAEVGQFMRKFTQSGTDHEMQEFIEHDIDKIARKNNVTDAIGQSGHDSSDTYEEKRAKEVGAHIASLDEQEAMRLSPDSFTKTFVQADDTKERLYTGSAAEKAAFQQIKSGALNHINRAQGRNTDIFVNTIESDRNTGTVTVTDRRYVDAIRQEYKDNPEATTTYYAKKLGLEKPNEAARRITGIKLRLRTEQNPDGTYNYEDITDIGRPGDWNPPSTKGSGAQDQPATEPNRVILTDARGNPIDSNGNPLPRT